MVHKVKMCSCYLFKYDPIIILDNPKKKKTMINCAFKKSFLFQRSIFLVFLVLYNVRWSKPTINKTMSPRGKSLPCLHCSMALNDDKLLLKRQISHLSWHFNYEQCTIVRAASNICHGILIMQLNTKI